MREQAHDQREDVVVTLAAEILRSFGEVEALVRGASMVPTMFPGDVVVIRRETAQSARLGGVMLFLRNGVFCTHRLIDKTEENGTTRLIARGDALDKNDPPFAEDQLLGQVAVIIRGGKRIDLGRQLTAAQRLLRTIVQRSSVATRWLLRWNSLRGRLAPKSRSGSSRAQWQPQESV
jgi:signal peptidase I